jgi:hypothetical protein
MQLCELVNNNHSEDTLQDKDDETTMFYCSLLRFQLLSLLFYTGQLVREIYRPKFKASCISKYLILFLILPFDITHADAYRFLNQLTCILCLGRLKNSCHYHRNRRFL